MSKQGTANLMVHGGANNGTMIPLSGRPLTLGRRQDNDVVLNDTTVSRRHALIMEAPGGFVLRDLSTTNGTYVNMDRVGDGERALADGDRIRLADSDVTLVFRQDSPGTVTVDKTVSSVDETWVRRLKDEEASLGPEADPPIFGKDSDLFRLLQSKRGTVVEREEIANRLWPELVESGLANRVIDESVARIRGHIEEDSEHPEHLISIGETGLLLV